MAFKIPKPPSSTNKSIRFSNNMIQEVEAAIRGQDCTFSAFVVAAVRAALDDLKEQEKQERNHS
ncbi:YlcI/YnfO family protein [uncultured Dysosmobacter sp.]|uniref:YlcI/YnfO family protein n=1 Tax=uncultured Dysosmobacter sp. TaxID=2591384 RepID=UPI00260BA97E|nr:YlcI/YnfO family protein [uncultured Dysosmobacter sp.]